jgi:hypothetical protein
MKIKDDCLLNKYQYFTATVDYLLLLLLFITFMQVIYNYIPETNHVSSAYNIATILWLHFMVHVILFPMMNILYFYVSTFQSGTPWRSWLRHCATSRKVAGSIADGVIGIFYSPNPSGRTGPGVDSASNRNEYQEYFLGGKRGRCIGLTNLPPSCADCFEIWEPHSSRALRACPGL